MASVQAIIAEIFEINHIWWLVIKAFVWLGIAITILVKTDSPHPEKSLKSLKSSLGFFLLFIFLSGGLIYLLFGQVPV